MNIQISGRLFAAAILILTISALPVLAQTRVVNMIPQNRSGETNQDSEPTLAIDPTNYSRMAGSAFTWDNLNQSPMTTATAPIYVSSDRGVTWALALIVPSQIGSGFPTGDINLFFGSTLSGAPLHQTSWLYTGILRAGGFPMTVLRTQDYLDPGTVMTVLDTRTGSVDQPHVAALSDSGGLDKLYVGFNNGYGCVAPGGRSSTLDVSQSAAVAAPTFTLDVIQKRNTACQDGFAQVPAAHPDGTVYAAFIGDWNGSPRIVVVRDDAWGGGATPFTVLTDPSDSAPGRFVTPVLTLQSGAMGNTRLGASNLSIAVDPRNSDRVYVAYGDSNGANSETIHVRRSTDRGQNWPPVDLLTVTNAMNPQIAINADGTVGVLYQRVVSNRWEAHLTRTTDLDATVFDDPGLLLANTDATTPSATFQPYIGDYASLRAAGKNFVGIFSASNYPDTANFPLGITFQRYVDWGTHALYADAAHTTLVSPSIDPYFFEVDTGANLYVKDRPEDLGAEPDPSTLPMWESNDIWLRKFQDPPHTFAHTHEDAEYRTGTSNPNYVYVSVRNRGAAPSAGTEQLTLYWAKASSGLSWPDPWGGGIFFGTALMGNPIGTVTLPVIPANTEYIQEFAWNPPDPSIYTGALAADQNHFCLLARVTTSTTAPFGMTFPEQAGDLYGNVQKNNHIAWKNIHVYDLLPGIQKPAHALIANFGQQKMTVKLTFTAADAEGNHVLLERGTLRVSLGEKLKAISRQTRLTGDGLKEGGDDNFQVVKEAGFLQNIPLEAKEYATLDVAYVPNNAGEKSKGYAITVTQLEQTSATDRIVGGQTFVFGAVKGFGTSAGGTAIAWHCPWWCWLLLLGIILLVLLLFWLRKK